MRAWFDAGMPCRFAAVAAFAGIVAVSSSASASKAVGFVPTIGLGGARSSLLIGATTLGFRDSLAFGGNVDLNVAIFSTVTAITGQIGYVAPEPGPRFVVLGEAGWAWIYRMWDDDAGGGSARASTPLVGARLGFIFSAGLDARGTAISAAVLLFARTSIIEREVEVRGRFPAPRTERLDAHDAGLLLSFWLEGTRAR